MPSLYGTGTSYTVTASNVITLYKVSTSSAVITATTYSTNLVGLYGGYWSPDPITQFVNTIVAGPGISVNTSSGNVTVSNTGVLSLRAGTNTNVSSTTGNITIWTTPVATGVTSLTAGTGISVSTSTGSVTVTNVGVTGLIAGTNTNISSTTGNITIWTTGGSTFDISTWTNQRLFTTSSVQFNQLSVTGSNISSSTAAVSINLSSTTSVTPLTNTSIWAVNRPGSASRFLVDTYVDPDTVNLQDKSFVTGRRARGTASAPAAVQNGDFLFRINAYGYNGTNFGTNAAAGMNFIATETFTTASNSGKITFDIMAVGGTTSGSQILTLQIDTSGVLIPNNKNLRFTGGGDIILTNTGSNITFPDGTVQTTAFTGTVVGVSSLAAGAGISVSTSTGSVVVTNTGVLSLIAGTNTNISSTSGNITIWTTPVATGVTSITAGTGISVSTSTGSVTVTNVGVTGLIAGTNTNISSTTGNITIWSTPVATGVTSITAGSGISVSTSTGSVTVTNIGVTSITAGTNTNVSSTSGDIVIWTNTATVFDISTWTNQRLFTTSSVQFSGIYATTGTQVNQTISAGGYPLDGNGQALIEFAGVHTPAIVASNYISGKRGSVHIRAYSQNVSGGTTTTNAPAILVLETSRGTGIAPTAQQAGDTMGQLYFGGYDGTTWPGTSGGVANVVPARIYVSSSENWANNGTTTTNAGARITMDLQPQGAWLDANSRQSWLNTSWSAGNTATTSAPQLNLGIGTNLNQFPTLTPSSGFGSFGVGQGATNLNLTNVRTAIIGVVSADTAPDNGSLPNTTFITMYGNRGSGLSGRRQLLAAGDAVSGLSNFAQTVPNGTGNGLSVGTLAWTMLEASTSTAVGSRVTISTANSGTTTVQTRLQLSNLDQHYRSDLHTFYNAAGGSSRLILNTTLNNNTYNSDNHTFNATSGLTPRLTLTTGTSNYNNDTQNFNNSAGSSPRLVLVTSTSTYNNDQHIFRNLAGTVTVLTLNPSTGTSNYNNDTQNFYNSAATTLLASITTATGVNFKGYTESLFVAAYTATFAPNVSTATIWAMTLGGNVTFNGFTNPVAGQSASFYFVQDSTGTRTLSSTFKFANGSKTLTTTPGATDMIAVTYGGSIGYYASLVKGFV